MADMDELEWNGCRNDDLRQHVQRWSQHDPVPTPSFLSNGLHAAFSCMLQKLREVHPAHSGVKGCLHRRLQHNTEVSGLAAKELIWVPLAM